MEISHKGRKHPKVCTILLNWNCKKDTLDCLDSLSKSDYPNHEVVVVDNASADDSVKAIRSRFQKVKVIANEKNEGFAEGNNVGARYALSQHADYLFILNNDTTLADDCISRLVEFSRAHPKAGAVGAKIYYYSLPNVIWSAGSELFLGKSKLRGRGQIDAGQYDSPWLAPQVVGAAMLVPSKVVRQIGLFDKDYFAYYEETKFCTLARKAGYEVWYCPSAKVWHKIAASTGGGTSPLSVYYLVRNRFYFIGDALPFLEKVPAYLLWSAEVLARLVIYCAKLNLRLVRAVLAGAFHGIAGVRGECKRKF